MVFGKIQSSVCTNKGCLPLPYLDNKEHFFFLTLTVLNNRSAARGSEQHLCLIGILCKIEIRHAFSNPSYSIIYGRGNCHG